MGVSSEPGIGSVRASRPVATTIFGASSVRSPTARVFGATKRASPMTRSRFSIDSSQPLEPLSPRAAISRMRPTTAAKSTWTSPTAMPNSCARRA